VVLLFFGCKQKAAIMPSLKETFSKNDKNPFGAQVMYRQAAQLYKKNKINVKKDRLQKSLGSNTDTGSLYISVSKNYFLDEDDLNAALNFVHKGNTMFIASENFDSSFLKSMGLSIQSHRRYEASVLDMKNTGVHLNPEFYADSSFFSYYFLPLDHHFGSPTDSVPNVLGRDEYGRPNFVILFYGLGRFYIHCEPRVFSNYFLLQKDNYQYLQSVLAFVPTVPEHVLWDDYYNKRNTPPAGKNAKSGLALLLQFPAMAWAFWLLLLLLAVYLFFGSKRRQRIVQVLPPNTNTSVAFSETISRLYLQQKDNRGIADKMILYFLEHIRTQYFLNTHVVNELFLTTLSRKSNVPLEETERLFATIQQIQQMDTIDEKTILQLNKQIELFYKIKVAVSSATVSV
jgi:hypothetical protein